MKMQVLAGAAVLALIATADASAATKKAGAYAEPSQPVAYSKLDSYLKASPTKRAKQDWSIGSAQTASTAPIGTPANTSATTQTPAPAPDATAGTAATAPPASDQTAPATQAPPATPPDQMAPATPPAGGAAPATPAPNGT